MQYLSEKTSHEDEYKASGIGELFAAAPDMLAALESAQSKNWVHNAAITNDTEALRAIVLEFGKWWNYVALPTIERAKGGES